MAKKGYCQNLEVLTNANNSFRKVLYTGEHMQLVLMSLLPKEDIGSEVHDDTDQFFRFESGTGQAFVNDNKYEISDGFVLFVPAGSIHNVINTGVTELKFYTIYSPAEHLDRIEMKTKEEASYEDEHFDGQTTEFE